jgi:HEAT repeat protein
MQIFAVAVLVLGVANILMLVLLVLRRVRLARRGRRWAATEERLKPMVLAFLGGEVAPPVLSPHEQDVLADMLGAYGRVLRGPSAERIAAYFERNGVVQRELEALAGDRSVWRRAAAAHRLGDIHAESAVPGLIAALDDPSRDVRTAAVRSLGRLAPPDAVDPLLAVFVDGRAPSALIGWALLQIGVPALPRLRVAMAGPDAANRAAAVLMVGLLGAASDADALADRLRDTSAEVRAEAARALGRLGVMRHQPELVLALDDRVPDVRAAAATALGRLQARVLEPLIAVAQDDRFEVARAAAYAAAAIDLEATAAVAGHSPHLLEAVDVARLG